MKKIDAHAHIGYFGGWCNVGVTPDKLVSQMNEYEIEKTIICAIPNESVKEAIEKHPNRLIGIYWADPKDGQNAIDEIYNYVTNYNFKGIKLHPLLHSFIADEALVYPIAQAAEDLNIPLFIHCGHPPYSLPWSIAGLAEKFPNVKIVMIHMGHGHGVYIQASIDMAKKYPNLYLETSGMPMQTKIKEAYEQVGSDRIMFGSDAPFHHHLIEITKGQVCELDEDALENYYYNNCKKLMNF